eukprot:TRINITY_DN19422_c0_g1_i1.p1 TRINITY_DN19422_c0_g1~~TRINITY_DN19422_c0_g1_i1.p1  ORF type:complete len:131 (-),score=12.32 TRINITY_DN19422_c0_g1_i1:59-406(-)
MGSGISSKGSHVHARNQCVTDIANMLGYMSLLHSDRMAAPFDGRIMHSVANRNYIPSDNATRLERMRSGRFYKAVKEARERQRKIHGGGNDDVVVQSIEGIQSSPSNGNKKGIPE